MADIDNDRPHHHLHYYVFPDADYLSPLVLVNYACDDACTDDDIRYVLTVDEYNELHAAANRGDADSTNERGIDPAAYIASLPPYHCTCPSCLALRPASNRR